MSQTDLNVLYKSIDSLIEDRLYGLREDFEDLPDDDFVGQHQWILRTNGTDLWCTCETQGTYFDDDCTLASGPQQWDHSSFEQMEDETEEEYDARFAAGCRPEFPEAAAREFLVERISAKVREALDLLE